MPVVDQLPYTPWTERGSVVEGTFRWRLGVRPLDLRDWIELGPDADDWIDSKPRLLSEHRDTVFAVCDDVEPESHEVATALVAHLRTRWPDRYAGCELDASLHPLDAAARLVPEDFVLMVERGAGLVFGGGSVCFPNRWDLRSKLGLSMTSVHRPVSRLNDQLAPAVDGFLERLRPERSFWRLGWGLLDVADGYTPTDGTGPDRPADPAVDELFVRVERETLRRFPRTRAVLFTIRTYVTPIANVLCDPDASAALARSVAAMPSDVLDYKDLTGLADSIVSRASARPT